MLKYYNCRCCTGSDIFSWLSLPKSPVANALFDKPNFDRYSLDLNYCLDCGHLQLNGAPEPNGVFSDYRYKTSVSKSFCTHFEKYAKNISEKYLSTNSKILEIGSNDGYLLDQFKKLGHSVFGVEPSKHVIDDYTKNNIDLVTGFFTTSLVKEQNWQGQFDLVCANNVMAHIPDTFDVVKAISASLKDNAIFVAECGDQSGITSGKYLDNVYHEHIDYYTPYSFSRLLERAGLIVESVEPVMTHGLSFRIVARKKKGICYLEFDKIDIHQKLIEVNDSIKKRKQQMAELINNRSFVAYGAAAKAVTALYTLEMVNDQLIGVVDDNELKQGHYFPGTNILITDPSKIDKNSIVVITAWNVFEDIKNKLKARGHKGEILCML